MKLEFDQRAEHHGHIEFPWHTAFQNTVVYIMSVDPGRTGRFTYTNPVDARINALIVSAYVYNNRNPFTTPGWYVRTLHINQETPVVPSQGEITQMISAGIRAREARITVRRGGGQNEPTTRCGGHKKWRYSDDLKKDVDS